MIGARSSRVHLPRPGAEEYLDNEKYQLRHWDRHRPDSLAPFITRLNRIRRSNPALQHDSTLRFHHCDNPRIVAYTASGRKYTLRRTYKPC